MKLIEVKKPETELTASDSPELKQGPWRITGWFGTDGNYYERYDRQAGMASEKWYRLVS